MDLKKKCPLPHAVFSAFLVLSAGCAKNNTDDNTNDNLDPSIHRFFPAEAGHGSFLILEGEGFSPVASENIVTLNGVAAKVVLAEPEKLMVEVQKDARCTGPERACSGPVHLSRHEKTATAEAFFTYVPQLIVSTVVRLDDRRRVDGYPYGIAVDKEGNLFVSDVFRDGENLHSYIRKISPQGISSIFAGGAYPLGRPPTGEQQVLSPRGIAVDAEGNLFVADFAPPAEEGELSGCIRKISPTGEVSIFAHGKEVGGLWPPSGIAVDKAGNLLVTEAFPDSGAIWKVTSTTAELSLVAGRNAGQILNPSGIAADSAGNIYFTEIYVDGGCNCIRKLTLNAQGQPTITVFIESFVAVDGNGTLERLVPEDIAIDAAGNLYASDANNHRIRKISPTGEVSTFAGSGSPGFQDGPARSAQFHFPNGVAIDTKTGTLYVLDLEGDRARNSRIRKIALE